MNEIIDMIATQGTAILSQASLYAHDTGRQTQTQDARRNKAIRVFQMAAEINSSFHNTLHIP
jgi:hypothetical protein